MSEVPVRRAGYSLIEISAVTLVVVILVGIAISVGGPGREERAVDDAAAQVVVDIRRLQELAISRNVSCAMVLGSNIAGEDGYRLEEKAGILVEAIPLPAGARFDPLDLGRRLCFDPLGGVDPGTTLRISPAVPHPWTLTVRSVLGTASRAIEVQPGTGLARLP
jgi:hypothetical protein